MFGSLGFPELLFILVIALLIFGPKRLPEMGRTIGRGMAEFRRATSDLKRSIEQEIDLNDRPPARPSRPAPKAPETAPKAPVTTMAPVTTPKALEAVPKAAGETSGTSPGPDSSSTGEP